MRRPAIRDTVEGRRAHTATIRAIEAMPAQQLSGGEVREEQIPQWVRLP
jgi:hypothetical protein